ncbi:MAG: replication and repair protein RecF [Nitrobacter vulgaris]|nr:replication and repair protein RecF [Nitrobacter vulgaris]
MIPSRIRRLSLTRFRNYRAATFETPSEMVVLVGPNGAGKTNCLEAVSLLSPGRGLRRATREDIADNTDDGSWAVSAEVQGALGLATLGTGIDAPNNEAAPSGRRCRIDREPVGSAAAFGDHLRMVWLTPSMDGLFTGSASERRRFLDRLVLAIDSDHSGRVAALERSLRSRNRLLEMRNYDDLWCCAVERETAELAVAVAAMRAQTVTRLSAALEARGGASSFPSARIGIGGWMENALLTAPATTVEKALLIGLVLAHAGLVAEMTGITPLLLLDEVVAHLDPDRRGALFGELKGLGAQVWMSGADPAAFANVGAGSEIFDVDSGRIARRAPASL